VRAGPRHGPRRQDADPPRPDRDLQRRLRADCSGIDAARAVIAAFALPENAGKGAIQLNGRMVELLHEQMARRTLAVAQGIEALASAN
jgi:citrate lyase beta subunit